MIKILIADDHAILRRRLKELLAVELNGAVCVEAEDGQEVLALDLSMPVRRKRIFTAGAFMERRIGHD